MSSLKNKDRHISDKPSIFRLLDLSVPQPLGIGSWSPQPSFAANFHVISENLKQVIWYQWRIQNPVKCLKAVDYFCKTLHLRCLTGLWIWFPFWDKKVYSVEFNNENQRKRTILNTNKRHPAGSATHEAIFSKFVIVRSSCYNETIFSI